MASSTSEDPSEAIRGEARTVAVLLVRMVPPPEGPTEKDVGLGQRFGFMSAATSLVRKSDGIVAHALDDTVVGCFEGASAADEASAAAKLAIQAVADRRAAEPSSPEIAVALDYGEVHFLRYAEGLPLDPQGAPIDRCRHLVATAPAGAALATTTLRDRLSARDEWKGLPKVPIAGLEGERAYQLKGRGQPFEWRPTIRVEAKRYDELRDRLDDCQYQLARKDAQIARLEQLMREIAGDIDARTGELTRLLTDAKTEQLRRRAGDLRRAQLRTLLPLLADGAAGLRESLAAQQELAELIAQLQERYPDQDWSDVDFWVRLLAIPTSDVHE